jgi:hypothetical protein
MGMVVNPYLFGMTNPHERNRYCSNNRAKDELVHWPSIFEKIYPGSCSLTNLPVGLSLTASREDWLLRHAHEGHRVEIKVANLA